MDKIIFKSERGHSCPPMFVFNIRFRKRHLFERLADKSVRAPIFTNLFCPLTYQTYS